MSSPIGYPQGNAYPMFSSTSAGNNPVAVGKEKAPLYVSTTPDGGIKLAGDGLDWTRIGYDIEIVLGGQSNGDSRASLVNIETPHPGAWLYDKQEKVTLLVEPAGKTGPGWINNVPAGLPADATAAARHSCATTLAKQLLQYGFRLLS